MHEFDLNRVEYYSKEDMAAGQHLQKAEQILRADIQSNYTDINQVLELYNIKKYFDNEVYLKSWSQNDIDNFKQNITKYARIIGQFMGTISDNNVVNLYSQILGGYIHSFWELVNNQSIFKRISKSNFSDILTNEPHVINEILIHKGIVDYYDNEIKHFMLTYSRSAEILLSIYEVLQDVPKNQKLIPKSLTIQDKEIIISNYLDSNVVNYNYIGLIQNARNRNDFKVSDKTRLKAKRLHKSETEKFFSESSGMKYGVSISFPENAKKIKDCVIDHNFVANYSYSLDFIKQNCTPYSLFKHFKYLFEYVDIQNRIELVSKKGQIGIFEQLMGVRSQHEYRVGTAFNLTEMASHIQIAAYSKIVGELNNSLENILHHVFAVVFKEKYEFADNARFTCPSASISNFEKVRLLAPEFESVLKQFKLYVEDGNIDFELLQISSLPCTIKDVPSLNQNKYIYLNEGNKEIIGLSNLFYSNQTHLTYVDPFKEKKYPTLFDLLTNEDVKFSGYEEHQKQHLNYLIDKGYIFIDNHDFIQITNIERLLILKDLYENEVASFFRYPLTFQEEAQKMVAENIALFESLLFSRPEQAYFNYFLNKSDFTNGLDLRNSYLHGTQANPEEIQKHEYAYFTYLKLLILTMLKIDDDLFISKATKNKM